MKKMKVSVLCCCLMLFFLSSARADSWNLSPGGEIAVNGMGQITFELSYINDGESFLSDNWGANLWFDPLELAPVAISASLGFDTGGDIEGEDLYKILGLDSNFDPLNGGITIQNGENLLASITFNILDPDMADQVVEYDLKMVTDPSEITCLMEVDGTKRNGTLAMGADVVTSPVPVPGAVFLLCPGLAALAWGRRKLNRSN